uniref:UBZ2-type domain-containing protein n=1 Tax=Nothoprocta perdicaria TaxID=30464 RepID=A0A8C7EBP5_NOTPE
MAPAVSKQSEANLPATARASALRNGETGAGTTVSNRFQPVPGAQGREERPAHEPLRPPPPRQGAPPEKGRRGAREGRGIIHVAGRSRQAAPQTQEGADRAQAGPGASRAAPVSPDAVGKGCSRRRSGRAIARQPLPASAGWLSQLDIDGHLARCLSESADDVVW